MENDMTLTRRARRGAVTVALVAGGLLTTAACAAPHIVISRSGGGVTTNRQATTASQTTATPPAPLAADAPALNLQQQFVRTVKAVSPSVVQIETSLGLGSGVIYDSQGDIVTNSHVVGRSSVFKVTLSDGRALAGRLVGTYPADDLAVIRVNGSNLHPAVFGDSSKLEVGDIVLAIGNPLGLQSSVTQGIVSAVGRTVPEGNGVTLPDVIQSSAAINPGNSGGALVDLQGEVVGIPTLGIADQQSGGVAQGIGFSISSNVARSIADQLIRSGRVTSSNRAYLGVQVSSVGSGEPGVLVAAVGSGTPAAQAGLQAGDLIQAIDGRSTADASQLAQVLAGLKPGQTVKVVVLRNRQQRTFDVTLGQLPG